MKPIPTSVIGAGKLACALVPLLGPAGFPVDSVASKRLASARRACRGVSQVITTRDLDQAVRGARLVLLAVPDSEISPVALRLADCDGWERRTVLHHAGSLGVEPLEPLGALGAAVGVMHPLQSLGRPDLAAEALAGSRARIEGDPRGRAVASRLARGLGLTPLRLPARLSKENRSTYHAAAALVSNDLIALLDLGTELFESLGLSRTAARGALLALAQGTLSQAEGGLKGALTGPVVRGDTETFNEHLRILRRRSPDDAEVHRLLSRRLARLARRHGSRRN